MLHRAVNARKARGRLVSLISNIASYVVLPLIVLGCGQRPTQQEGSSATDSAGVRIVESVRGAWTDPWRVDVEPLLSIGSVEGDPDQELDQVAGAVRLTPDRIVVANGGRFQLLFFDGEGHLVARAGGRGGGPGEFQSLEWIARYGADSVLAVDVSSHRVSYFDADGKFGRSVRLVPNVQVPFPRPVGVFGDGSLLTTQGSYRLGADPPVRTERTQQALFRYSADGSTATMLGSFPGPEWVIAPIGPVGQWERRRRPFGRMTAFAAARNLFYVADNATYEIRVYSLEGRPLQVMRKTGESLPLEEADIRSFEDSALAASDPRARRQMRTLFERLPPSPPTHPAYAPDIHIDTDLDVWVRESSHAGDRRSRWSVFAASGELLGTVRLPDGVDVLDIGSDYVLGLKKDEMDVEYVQMFRLRRVP